MQFPIIMCVAVGIVLKRLIYHNLGLMVSLVHCQSWGMPLFELKRFSCLCVYEKLSVAVPLSGVVSSDISVPFGFGSLNS